MTTNNSHTKTLSEEEFIRLLSTTQRPLFLHILPMVGNGTDADEILQETNLIMWAKKDQFESDSN